MKGAELFLSPSPWLLGLLFIFLTLVLGMELKTLGLKGKGSTTGRHLQPFGEREGKCGRRLLYSGLQALPHPPSFFIK